MPTPRLPRTCADRGGTFTDLVVWGSDGRVRVRKVPSDRACLGELAQGPLTFGTTVATNALLERRGARTLLVVSPGLGELVQLGDMSRPALFDPERRWPAPLCAAVVELPGRLDAQGLELEPARPEDAAWPELSGFEAVAIALLHSPLNPAHELAAAAWLRARAPGLWIALGHSLSPELGLLARIETALVDAALTPALRRALAQDAVPPDALALRSDGSLCAAHALRAPDAVLSGPAGGVLAVQAVARQGGFEQALGLDMGGTSTDLCLVRAEGPPPMREGEQRVDGVRLRRPALEVETIAAGGGSVLRLGQDRATVGPDSAGANPGPACAGRGGPPTLTDAALAAGLVDPGAFDPPLVLPPGVLPGPPERFLDIAREVMAQAARRLGARRGVDLRDHALVAYGGAAGQHAAEVAARLGIRTVLVHPCAAVLCAWGQALARREEGGLRPIWARLPGAWPAVEAAWAALESELPALGELERSLDLRYAGTDHALTVQAQHPEQALAALEQAHRARYGFVRDAAVEVVNARVRTRAPAAQPPPVDEDPWGLGEAVATGPALLRCPTTAVWVPPGWSARRDRGLLRLDALAERHAAPEGEDPYALELWSRRFMAAAEEAGEVLRRLARSVNIRERLDFSCAVFDGEGGLVANAPHIPVHLGAMGDTVRDLLRRHPDAAPGSAWLCNDPQAGGSHLPDLTVVTPVDLGGARVFVASRGHHVDVGGLTPGSMPPMSRTLADEGLVFRQVPLVLDGRLRPLAPLLAGCRDVPTVAADLEAQIAANHTAARALQALGPAGEVLAWMGRLTRHAEAVARDTLARLPEGEAEDQLDGLPLRLRLRREQGVAVVDLSGTGGPHPGNLNAPTGVLRAAVLYGLRCLGGPELPLNDGALRALRLVYPTNSLVSPPPDAAVVGGNVETSQRLVDLLFRAVGARAAGQGTMNNLTLGGEGWSFYETLGGGEGASAAGPGADARQVGMTNTRATDPELLERRLPLRVVRFAARRGSGGPGRHRGGEGLVRELEVLAPCTAALLATRRDQGAPGLEGGGPGAPGEDRVRLGGVWRAWDGQPVALGPGDRVRVCTPGGGGWGPA